MAVDPKHATQSREIYIGCSGWAYPTWKPDFYPPSTPAKKFLEYYATRLNSVEVNYTFRALPSQTTIHSWLAAAGDHFRFSFKAPQRITHIARLKNCLEPLEAFARALVPVAEANRLGVILFQLPPTMKADPQLLENFLTHALKTGYRLSFEFRHESWFSEPIYSVLRHHSVALCVAESDELTTPDQATAPFRCYRLRKATYSEGDLSAISEKLKHDSTHGDVFAYFKHEETPEGAINAANVLAGLRP